MRYFIDTEFIEDGRTIDLISVGICAEDGRELYIQIEDCDYDNANEWVRENVLPHLEHREERGYFNLDTPWRYSWEARKDIQAFCDPTRFGPPEFWGYYAAYDWVALCQLFGDMSRLPAGWPMYCHDYRQYLDEMDLSRVAQPDDSPHHALADARWLRNSFMEHHGVGTILSPPYTSATLIGPLGPATP